MLIQRSSTRVIMDEDAHALLQMLIERRRTRRSRYRWSSIETRARPNQGIRRSARTALRVGGAVWLCVGLLIALAAGMPDLQIAGLADRSLFGLLFGLVAGQFFGLMYGGIACFQHVLLRLILWRGDTMPWRYAAFLDYCADHMLLYRVGGGYLFVHRLLLEYFAALDTSRP